MTSASQWKRCFTNPGSWTKWNIFSFSPSPHPGTAHTTFVCHTGRTRKRRIFLQKGRGFLGAPRLAEEEPDSCASPPPDRAKDSSTRTLSLSQGNSPCLWFFWRGKQQIFHPNPGWKSETPEEAAEKAKWFPQRLLSSGTASFGQLSLVPREFHPNAKNLGNNPTNSKWEQGAAHHQGSYKRTNQETLQH